METDVRLRAEQETAGRFRRSGLLRRTPGSVRAVPRAIEDGKGRVAVERREGLYKHALACADVVSAVLALALCVQVFGDDALRLTALLALPLIVAVSKVKGLYDRDELLIRKTTMDEAPQLFQLATLYALLLWLFDDLVVIGELGKTQVLVLWLALWLSAVVCRRIARTIAARVAPPERILFVGDAGAYARLRGKLDPGLKVELVGRMSLQRTVRARGGDRSHDVTELRELIRWTDAHRVVIEPQVLPADEMLEFVRAAKAVGVRVSLLPRVFDVVGTTVVFDELDGMTLLGVRRFGLTRSSMAVKRVFDLAGAAALLLVLAPVMAAIALAIKLDSRGPVLFRQTRVGRNGVLFRICKFRTMVAEAEALKDELRIYNEATGGLFKITDDPRITRVGRFLRRTSLDELPQLFNVVRGDMSLVGPRPLVRDEDELVTGLDRRRLSLTPGMTGHWQILGSSRVPLPEMVKIDYLYVAGWSLWTDLKILLRTVPYMLRRRGR